MHSEKRAAFLTALLYILLLLVFFHLIPFACLSCQKYLNVESGKNLCANIYTQKNPPFIGFV